jgi:hypothetical protein
VQRGRCGRREREEEDEAARGRCGRVFPLSRDWSRDRGSFGVVHKVLGVLKNIKFRLKTQWC